MDQKINTYFDESLKQDVINNRLGPWAHPFGNIISNLLHKLGQNSLILDVGGGCKFSYNFSRIFSIHR